MKKQLNLGRDPIGKLLLAFSIPCIISMLINSLYNIVDQIFIGQGVGTIGNAATNVIFPFVMICSAIAGLIGNGCAANLSLRLGEKNHEEAKRSIGSSIVLLVCVALLVAIVGEIFLPVLINLFGCTETVYQSALTYGRIILLGAPCMIIYTGIASIIRADGSPTYSMICLVIGALINLVLDPIFIFVFDMGVAGGAIATIIGQFVSFVIAFVYLSKIKSVPMKLKDFRFNRSIFKTLGLGLSSFITQMTVVALFVVMNNLMTSYGASSKFGSDIPLSVYGVISKINSLYISSILGIAIGSQPIIGFNYGAGNYKRVKEVLRKVLLIGLIIGVTFNFIFYVFPSGIASIFIKKSDPTYHLFMEFAVDFCRIFLLVCGLNFFEMTTSIVVQSLGNVKKATLVSFTRQIILFIPLAIILTSIYGLYGALYAAPIADGICFLFAGFIFMTEYKKLSSLQGSEEELDIVPSNETGNALLKKPVVITIAREYGSGGRYVGRLLAESLGIAFYDDEIIRLASLQSGFTESYIEENEQSRKSFYENDDTIFLAESKVIKEISKKPCVIIGRCADYILRDKKEKFSVFIYSSEKDKIKRLTKYYHIPKEEALKEIKTKNKQREKHYHYYTGQDWMDKDNYDLMLNSDSLGVEKAAELLQTTILKKFQ